MSLFNNDYDNNTKPDLTDPVPETGVKRWLFLFSNHFMRLMGLNLLFLLFCIPVVTIPAALCGMTRVTAELYLTGSCSVFSDFWNEFRRDFLGRLVAVFLMAFFPVSLCLWFFAFGLSSFGVGVSVVLLPVSLVSLCYFLAFSVDLCPSLYPGGGTAERVRLSFLAAIRHPKESLKLLLAPTLLYAASFLYLRYFMIADLFILFSGGQLILCCILSDLDRRTSITLESRL